MSMYIDHKHARLQVTVASLEEKVNKLLMRVNLLERAAHEDKVRTDKVENQTLSSSLRL